MGGDCCCYTLPHTATTEANASVRSRRRTRIQMLTRPRASALVAVFNSCLWACVWNHVLLQPSRAGAFLLGNGGPALLLPSSHTEEPAVGGHATRPQRLHFHSSRRRRRKRRDRPGGGRGGESSLNMNLNLRMTPSQPHPIKVAFQVLLYFVCCKSSVKSILCDMHAYISMAVFTGYHTQQTDIFEYCCCTAMAMAARSCCCCLLLCNSSNSSTVPCT